MPRKDDSIDPEALPWAKWPWQRCKSWWLPDARRARCDLRKGHDGPHVAERGMWNEVWTDA